MVSAWVLFPIIHARFAYGIVLNIAKIVDCNFFKDRIPGAYAYKLDKERDFRLRQPLH